MVDDIYVDCMLELYKLYTNHILISSYNKKYLHKSRFYLIYFDLFISNHKWELIVLGSYHDYICHNNASLGFVTFLVMSCFSLSLNK
jgi:hypothetical protein